MNVSYGSLNVRSGAGTSYPQQAALYRGDTVVVIGKQGSWSRILYNGNRTGYVSSAYLSTSSGGSSGTVNGGAIRLSVPSFKQNDSRWAKAKIGSSGKTISQIGCATTAIAMMESYRTGTTIYPDAMSKRLSYTSSGNVYWPGHYTAITGSSNLLSGIHSKLYQGKPVLFGAKNSYGGQHWVVITGFTGGSVSDSGAYTINDPGSNSRSTLKQFLSAYPTFYKYFYY